VYKSYQSHRDDLHGSRRFQPLVQIDQITVCHVENRDDTRFVPTVETVGYHANRPDGTIQMLFI
jgi:hypothetical protein